MISGRSRLLAIGLLGATLIATPGALVAEMPAEATDTASVTLLPRIDTFVDKGAPSAAHEGEDALVANGNSGWTKGVLLEFPIEGIPQGTVVSAHLVLDRALGQGTGVTVHPATSSFSASATWESRPSLGSAIGSAFPGWGDGTVTVPLTLNRASGPIRLGVRTPSTTAPARFWSSESSSGEGPALHLTIDTSTPQTSPTSCNQATVTFNRALVPSCGLLWGAAANAFSNRPGWPAQGPESHRMFESAFGRKFGLYSYYFNGSSAATFPRPSEIALARESGRERVLYMHWRIANDMTFADVVAGKADARIDRQAAYLKANFPEKLFVSLHSEMEPQIRPSAGSGRTAADFAAMYRYVVARMRAKGATNVIWVLAYGGYGKWATQPWFKDLYPGDAYVDWVGWHPYTTTLAGGQDFDDLMNSTYGSTDANYRGMYRELTIRHPGKPLILSEFGVLHDPSTSASIVSKRSAFYRSVISQLDLFPAIKAIVNFDTEFDEHKGNGYEISVLADESTRANFWELSQRPALVNPVPQSGSVH